MDKSGLTRLRREAEEIKKRLQPDYNTVVFFDKCLIFDSCVVTINGVSHQGTMEEMKTLLEPYIRGGAVVIYGESELKD